MLQQLIYTRDRFETYGSEIEYKFEKNGFGIGLGI